MTSSISLTRNLCNTHYYIPRVLNGSFNTHFHFISYWVIRDVSIDVDDADTLFFFLTFNKRRGQESLLRQVLSLRSFYFLIKLQLGEKKYITCLLSNFPERIDGKKNNNNTVTFQEQLSSECSGSLYAIFYLLSKTRTCRWNLRKGRDWEAAGWSRGLFWWLHQSVT